jgi:hypothetical protein
MDGTSEGDVGVGSKAGEAAVGELGNSGGAAAAAATEAAAMAGEAAGERAEETRRSIENATRDGNQKSYGSSNRRNKKSIPTERQRTRVGSEFPREAGKTRLRRRFGTGEVYTYAIPYYLWLYVCPRGLDPYRRTVATTYP